jgi:hypothetical protein
MITFDANNKIIQLDSFLVSEREILTAYVDWSVLDDHLKYGVVIDQTGGVAPIALYLFLNDGWKVRPLESDGITTITGNLLTDDGSSPISATLGNFNVLVNLETPVLAAAIEVSGGTTLTANAIASAVWANANAVDLINKTDQINTVTQAQSDMILEIYRLYGLDPSRPLIVTNTSRKAGTEIQQVINSSTNTTTITRS